MSAKNSDVIGARFSTFAIVVWVVELFMYWAFISFALAVSLPEVHYCTITPGAEFWITDLLGGLQTWQYDTYYIIRMDNCGINSTGLALPWFVLLWIPLTAALVIIPVLIERFWNRKTAT